MWSEPITFKLIVGADSETKTREVTVEARTAIGDAKFVGEGSNIDAAMQSLIGAVLSSPEGNVRGPHRWSRFDEGMRPQEGYFPMLGRTFTIEAPAKRNEQGQSDELTDEEARPIHAAILKILDEAESEIRRKLQALSPTYPTFRLRSR
jgi:hypothetical protein